MSKNRFLVFVGLLVMMAPLGCEAQVSNPELQIAGAVSPLPEDMRAGAGVMGYTDDGELVSIREGTNDLICLADQPGDEGFHAACYHASLEPYMARGRALRAEGVGRDESFRIRHEEADAGTLKMPDEPATVYNLSGKQFDPETGTVEEGRTLYALYIPYATAATTGLPERPAGAGTPWIMRAGTPSAHIMIMQ